MTIKLIYTSFVIILVLLVVYGILRWLGLWDMAWEGIKEAFRMARS